VALLVLWSDPARRDEALWISLFGCGVLLSIPFAPPWDAGICPYAVTIPFQAFLAALGVAVCARCVCALLKIPDVPAEASSPSVMPAASLSFSVLVLALATPLIHAHDAGSRVDSGVRDGDVRFLPGSSVALDESSFRRMKSALGSIAPWFRDEAKCLQLLRPGCSFGINWNDLGRYAVLPGAVDFRDCGRMKADVRLLTP